MFEGKEEVELLKRILFLQEAALVLQERQLIELLEIRRELKSKPVSSFTITQESPMLSISPGNSPVFTATPVPATSVPSTPPTWTSSDTTNAPISVDPTGLICTVAIPSSAAIGTSFTLTVSYTNADQTVATGTTTQTIVAGPSPDITSFDVTQTT